MVLVLKSIISPLNLTDKEEKQIRSVSWVGCNRQLDQKDYLRAANDSARAT